MSRSQWGLPIRRSCSTNDGCRLRAALSPRRTSNPLFTGMSGLQADSPTKRVFPGDITLQPVLGMLIWRFRLPGTEGRETIQRSIDQVRKIPKTDGQEFYIELISLPQRQKAALGTRLHCRYCECGTAISPRFLPSNITSSPTSARRKR